MFTDQPQPPGSQQCLFVTTRNLKLGIGQHRGCLNTLISELGFSAVLFSLAFERFWENLNVRYDMMDRWKKPFFLCMKYFLQQFDFHNCLSSMGIGILYPIPHLSISGPRLVVACVCWQQPESEWSSSGLETWRLWTGDLEMDHWSTGPSFVPPRLGVMT